MNSQLAFFSWDLERDLVFGDEMLGALFDLDGHDLARGVPIIPFVEKICENDRERVAKSIHCAIENGSPYQETYSIWHRNGKTRTVVAAGRCFRDVDGVPSIYSGTIVDITEARAFATSDPLRMHCLAALELARLRANDLVVRYINSALGAIGNQSTTAG